MTPFVAATGTIRRMRAIFKSRRITAAAMTITPGILKALIARTIIVIQARTRRLRQPLTKTVLGPPAQTHLLVQHDTGRLSILTTKTSRPSLDCLLRMTAIGCLND